jgi:hypothetical protein
LFGRAWGSHVPHIALDVCPFNTPGERLRSVALDVTVPAADSIAP